MDVKGVVLTATSIISKLVSEMLKDSYDIFVADNFGSLISLLKKDKFDFMVVDRTLKDISSKDLFVKIIENGVDEIPPTVLLTQGKYDPEEDGIGYSFVLRKPFTKEQIFEAVEFAVKDAAEKQIKKVLIIDDSKTSRNILKKILLNNGYQCVEAENAKKGFELALAEKPDVIIVDYIMPDYSGVEFARMIAENNLLKSIPIILITGSQNLDEVMEEGFDSGIAAYFSKPYKEEEILGFFHRYISSQLGIKILVLDDSSLKRKAIYSGLTVANNKVVTSENISQAISYFEDNKFDIVLIDLILNNESAIDAVKAFRELDDKVPIIVYSSIGDRKNVYSVLEAGASDFLWSPIEMRELVLKVKIWAKYVAVQKVGAKVDKLSPAEFGKADFMEIIDYMLNFDKLNGKVSSLICIKNLDESLIPKVQKVIRKDSLFEKYGKYHYIYLSDAGLDVAIKVCFRLNKAIGDSSVEFGLAITDEVNTVEELFKRAEVRTIKL